MVLMVVIVPALLEYVAHIPRIPLSFIRATLVVYNKICKKQGGVLNYGNQFND